MFLLSCFALCPFQSEIEEFERINSNSHPDFGMDDTDDPIEMFRSAVITLTTKGNVENYMKPIIAKLKHGANDISVLNDLIDVLYDQVSFSIHSMVILTMAKTNYVKNMHNISRS